MGEYTGPSEPPSIGVPNPLPIAGAGSNQPPVEPFPQPYTFPQWWTDSW